MPYWREARVEDDEAIVAMSLSLYHGDPPVTTEQIRETLAMFREQPVRGRALVLDIEGRPAGYAFLVSFWSNELGGEICTIDEIYLRPAWRSRGCGSRLIESLSSDRTLWPAPLSSARAPMTTQPNGGLSANARRTMWPHGRLRPSA